MAEFLVELVKDGLIMAKRNKKTSTERRIELGFGQGRGHDYKPWLRIQDVPSTGLVHRIRGWHTQRVHHLMSNLERDCFLVLQWSYPKVCDIREQFPLLPQEDTLEIADRLGVKHPTDPKTQKPIVMTSDFNLTIATGSELCDVIRTVKPSSQLSNPRTLEKLEIERIYWKAHGTDWGIITEKEIPPIMAKNLQFLETRFELPEQIQFTEQEVQTTNETLKALTEADETRSLSKICASCDTRLGYSAGTSLAVAYYLIAHRVWRLDMQVTLNPSKPLKFVL